MAELVVAKIKGFLKTTGMMDFAHSLKNDGLRATIKRFGWKFFAIVFVYYLVRDVTLYIILPWMIARHFIGE